MSGKQSRPRSDAAFVASDLVYTVCASLSVQIQVIMVGRMFAGIVSDKLRDNLSVNVSKL